MENWPGKNHESVDEEELKEFASKVQDLYVYAAEKYLEENDPLRVRIVNYYSHRPETERELTTVLGKENRQGILSYISGIESFVKDPVLFIERMERLYERQDVHARRRELNATPRLATDEEYELGVYTDLLEGQVRDAVLMAQRKGYQTFQSGFREKTDREQYMDFYDRNVRIPESVMEYLKRKGVKVNLEYFEDRTTLSLRVHEDRVVRLAEWKEIWDYLIEALPQSDGELVENMKRYSEYEDFRKLQDRLRG